jgi:hypothetical protein
MNTEAQCCLHDRIKQIKGCPMEAALKRSEGRAYSGETAHKTFKVHSPKCFQKTSPQTPQKMWIF